MKVYATPGNATQYTPKGDGSSAQRAVNFSWGPDGGVQTTTGPVPMEVSAATERNKAGSRRTMIRVATTLPKAALEAIANGYLGLTARSQTLKDLRIQTHLVVECDEDLIRQAAIDAASADKAVSDCGAALILETQIRELVAMVLGIESLPATFDAFISDGPLMKGLLGLNPIDTVAGAYGKQTAS